MSPRGRILAAVHAAPITTPGNAATTTSNFVQNREPQMHTTMRRLSGTESILYGGLVVGALDGLDAIVVFGLRGATPVRVFQGIAAGLLGRATFQGGLRTALLGLAIHFFIAFSIAATYYAASRRFSILVRRPLVCG